MAKNPLDLVQPQNSGNDEASQGASEDVNLQELAELVYKKLREEALLENDRTGKR